MTWIRQSNKSIWHIKADDVKALCGTWYNSNSSGYESTDDIDAIDIVCRKCEDKRSELLLSNNK